MKRRDDLYISTTTLEAETENYTEADDQQPVMLTIKVEHAIKNTKDLKSTGIGELPVELSELFAWWENRESGRNKERRNK